MSNAVSTVPVGLGNDQRTIADHRHPVGERSTFVGDLRGRAVGVSPPRRVPGCGSPPGGELETDVVDGDTLPWPVDGDVVVGVLRPAGGEVGVRRPSVPSASRDEQVGVRAPRASARPAGSRCTSGTAVPLATISSAALSAATACTSACAPVGHVDATVAPAGRLGEGEAGEEDVGLGHADADRCTRAESSAVGNHPRSRRSCPSGVTTLRSG